MRIVHLSDIHLSKENYLEFDNYYRDALIKDLQEYNSSLKIDVIVITGDLVDRGGHSLYEIEGYSDKEKYPNPYFIFEEIFIKPIIEELNFDKSNFIFIPGNHDVDETTILLKEEYELLKNINNENVTQYLKENKENLRHSKRIKNFKEFEKKFHNDNFDKYLATNNESTFVYDYNKNFKIGFLLINDSWRCRSIKFYKEDDNTKLFFGKQQLYDGIKVLKNKNTHINIALFHHSKANFEEKDEIEGFLIRERIDFMLYGHYHADKTQIFHSSINECHTFRGKASLLNPKEKENEYKPGYQIMDLNLEANKIVKIHYRVFNSKAHSREFIADTFVVKNGVDENERNGNNGYEFSRLRNSQNKNFLNIKNKEDFKSK